MANSQAGLSFPSLALVTLPIRPTLFVCVLFAGDDPRLTDVINISWGIHRSRGLKTVKHTTNTVNNTPKASFKCSNVGVTDNKLRDFVLMIQI